MNPESYNLGQTFDWSDSQGNTSTVVLSLVDIRWNLRLHIEEAGLCLIDPIKGNRIQNVIWLPTDDKGDFEIYTAFIHAQIPANQSIKPSSRKFILEPETDYALV